MKERKKNYIYLFRHGKTDFNEAGKFTGWMDSKLTLNGIKDAQNIGKKLRNKKFEVAIHTRLSRSKDTLAYVLKYHSECKKIILDDRMIERSYGILEGKKHEDFIKEVGERLFDLSKLKISDKNLGTKIDFERVKRFLGEKEYEGIHRGYFVKAKNGESFYDVEKRVKEFIFWLRRYVKENNVNVVISAHGNSIRLFRKIMERASILEMQKWKIPYDRVFVYKI